MKKIAKLLAIGFLATFTLISCSDSSEVDEDIIEDVTNQQGSYKGLRAVIDSLKTEIDLKVPSDLSTTNVYANNLRSVLEDHIQIIETKEVFMTIPTETDVVSSININVDVETHTWTNSTGEIIEFTIVDNYATYNFEYAIVDAQGEVIEKKMDGWFWKDSTLIEARIVLYENDVESSKVTWYRPTSGNDADLTFNVDGITTERTRLNLYDGFNGGKISFYYEDKFISESYRWSENGEKGAYIDSKDNSNNGSWLP